MRSGITIRQARPEDYLSYRTMEEEAFAGTDVKILTEKMFLTWINVHQQGFILALIDNRVCAHIYAQICDYDFLDKTDNRNLYKVTDKMTTVKTHNPNGNCLYAFSISSIHAGSANLINTYMVNLTDKLNKQYYGGAVRMPGLARYARKMNRIRLSNKLVFNYAQQVADTVKRRGNIKKKIFDPVVTPILRHSKMEFARVIPGFFPYSKGSESWGCVLYYKNINYK